MHNIIPNDLFSLLLIDKTKQKFGYDPLVLKRGSGRKIFHLCDICGKEKQNEFKKFIIHNSLSHNECKGRKIKFTNIKNYGVEHCLQRKDIKEKRKQTCLAKYGHEHSLSVPEIRKQIEETNIQKYGGISPFNSQDIQEKIKQTNLKRYGSENVSQSESINTKRKTTFVKKYGVNNPFLVNEFQKKKQQSCLNNQGANFPFQSKQVREKIRKNNLEKYGNENWGGYKYELKPRKHWLKQVWNGCKLDPDQKLPDRWTQGCRSKFTIICSCGNKWNPQFFSIYNGTIKSCGHNSGTSFAEQEVINYIKDEFSLNIEHRSIHNGIEFDGWVPSKSIAIEYNGLIWHSELFNPNKYKDYDKYKYCQNNNIRYVGIFEDEWLFDQDRVKNYLRYLLRPNYKFKIRPQQLTIKYFQTNNNSIKTFLNKYHYLSGDIGFSHIWCGYYDNELIGVMGFGYPGRQNIKGIELKRICLHPEFKCYGLWSYLLKNYVNKRLINNLIISYSDNRRDIGSLYAKIGFTLVKEIPPDYYWCKGQRRFHKSKLRKTPQEKLTGKTEKELRESQGYFRIWDCGKKKWQLQL